MARIRTIKPDFFTSLTVAELTATERLTFIGLWTHVDDEGRCVDEARLIAAALWPLDDNVGAATVDKHLERLEQVGLIVRYRVDGKRYLAVTGWEEHQRINRPTESKVPAPEQADPEPSPDTHGALSEDSPPEGKGKEGKGTGKGSASADADASEIEDQFEQHFWPVYPPTNGVKRDKQGALRVWRRLTLEQRRAAVIGARHKRQHFEQTGEQPPYAERFLRRHDFEDFQQPVNVDRDGNASQPVKACPDCMQLLSSHDDDMCERTAA